MQMPTHCLYTAGHRSGCLCQYSVTCSSESRAGSSSLACLIVCSMVQSMVKIMSYESQGSHQTCLLLSSAISKLELVRPLNIQQRCDGDPMFSACGGPLGAKRWEIELEYNLLLQFILKIHNRVGWSHKMHITEFYLAVTSFQNGCYRSPTSKT